MAPTPARKFRYRPLHGCAADENAGTSRRRPRSCPTNDDSRPGAAMPAGPCEPAVPGTRAEPALPLRRCTHRLSGDRSAISRTSVPGRASRMSPSSSTPSPIASSAGGSHGPDRPDSSSMRSSRPCTSADRPMTRNWSRIPTAGRNTSRCATPSGLPTRASSRPSDRSATAATMRSRRRSSACSRPRSYTVARLGRPPMPSNGRPSNGSTGSTIGAFSDRSGTSRPPRPKRSFTKPQHASIWPPETN